MKTEARTGTREAIIAAATNTVMTDGYNALSFRDLATGVGIKSASVHHHFPTKGDLAEVVVSRFRDDFVAKMEPLTALPFEDALSGYIQMFRGAFVGKNRLCLGAMMSAEVSALPPVACEHLGGFMEAHKNFLRTVFLKRHPRMPKDKLDARAAAVFAAIEGAQLVARGQGGDLNLFDEIVEGYRASGLLD